MTNQEPQYKRAVFEGLLDTLDVVLTDNGCIHMADGTLRGNYDIRDDGVWLRKNNVVDAMNWTPVCDLEAGPESPDPLTTPALPFPFTARQLAAFTLGGWGWFLGERFSDGTGLLDAEIVPLLLGGKLDTKLRESITTAFSALQSTRLNTTIPAPELWQMLVIAKEECETAETAAEAAHDWIEPNQPEAVREKRRLAYLAAVNPYRQKMREAQVAYDEAQETWRKAMVRELLNPVPPKPELSEAEREAEEKEFTIYGYEAHINLGNWAALYDVKPNDAAMLLCGHDPDRGQQHTGKDFLMLARRFTDHAQQYPAPRRLAHWWTLASEWMNAKRLGFITFNRDFGEALMLLDAQHHPVTELRPVPRVESDSTPADAPVADSASNAPAWTVTKPQRFGGYAAPLYCLLATAHREGRSCPTARDVLEAWRINTPAEIAKVLPDGFDYYDTKGNTKPASLDALRKAIDRMAGAR